MKVAIMSMQRILNYGSFMQALSLKTMVESLGHEVIFVDFHPGLTVDGRKSTKQIFRFYKNKLNSAVKNNALARKILKKRLGQNTSEVYGKFRECYNLLGLSDKYIFSYNADVLIIGSDEVFNCLQSNSKVGYAKELFGYKAKSKTIISYAASFGSTTLEGLKKYNLSDEVGAMLKRLDRISVRDRNSEQLIIELCGRTPDVHLDPVLVGNIENMPWRNIEQSGYVAVYGYKNRFTSEEADAIQRFAHSKGLFTLSIAEEQSFCDKNIVCRPDEIISYIKKADYVITDTFHGSIFSVICHKQFVAFCRRKNDTEKSYSTNEEKLGDMLERIGLLPRMINKVSELEEVIDKGIDYTLADEIRCLERGKALGYLSENLGMALEDAYE
ncbi:polysaccharide pyruvyl transferase family protein [Mediterraneibacter faecis]|uniref:polysaccharide pyruvyl transferase family protein n=1 Tax=Mediterraneibacter faecis TaxID=592978 RepID=UPI003F963AC7